MQTQRDRAIAAIKVGDVVYGVGSSGGGKLLLVYEITQDGFLVRHVPSMARARFGFDGKSQWWSGGGSCTITSTAALPAEIYDVVIGLDRKMRSARELTDYKLTKAEIQLLLTQDEYFKARPLPDA